jgi:hypothetical protein
MCIGSILISYWLDKFHRIQPAYTTCPRHVTAKFRLIKSTMHCQFDPAACDVSDMSGFTHLTTAKFSRGPQKQENHNERWITKTEVFPKSTYVKKHKVFANDKIMCYVYGVTVRWRQ